VHEHVLASLLVSVQLLCLLLNVVMFRGYRKGDHPQGRKVDSKRRVDDALRQGDDTSSEDQSPSTAYGTRVAPLGLMTLARALSPEGLIHARGGWMMHRVGGSILPGGAMTPPHGDCAVVDLGDHFLGYVCMCLPAWSVLWSGIVFCNTPTDGEIIMRILTGLES
jgi:hypothetical protein